MRNPVREAEERSVDHRPVFAICNICGEIIHGADNLCTGDDYVELNGSFAHYECAKCEKHKVNAEYWISSNGKTWATLTAEDAGNMLNALKEKYGDE